MVYGVYTKAKHNKVYKVKHNKSNVANHTREEENTAEGEDKI